ncbi:MAG: hypothetical protein ACI8RZ_005648, partial [Myxococcota bacterium]
MRTLPLLLLLACSEYEFAPEPTVSEGDTAPPPIDTAPPESVVHSDSWDLDEVAGIDVLFFGDTSGSMAAELKALGSQVTTFVERLATYTDRWQLLAVTGPSGCGVNGVLTPQTTDYAALFSAGITTPPGEDDVDEWGLSNSAQAVAESTSGGCNAGFVRDDARLHVIFISDEDDNSPGWDAGDADYWQVYTEAIIAAKGDTNQVVFSGVIGPTPKGCDGAEPGTGYAEAITATGGELLSICDAWTDDIDLLVDASVAWPIFHLTETPVQSTIEVFVNGDAATGWAYSGINNTIVFTESIPTIGD